MGCSQRCMQAFHLSDQRIQSGPCLFVVHPGSSLQLDCIRHTIWEEAYKIDALGLRLAE